ncbi:hypothetical protein AB0L04_13480 [Streptomyces glaucescens]|uniref:hypothetical protein n=1 Tax=Streptomyces glaucescens TaxID=1907 RepID=UPI003450B233
MGIGKRRDLDQRCQRADVLMTSLPARACLTALAVASSAVLLASCTSDDGETAGTTPSSTPTTSATASAATPGAPEKELSEQAEAALAGFHHGTLVESGVERVSEGIHTEPTLTKGEEYRITIACAGTGSAHLRFAPASTGEKATVPCDSTVVQQRITADKPVRIDIDGQAGAIGMIAWQIVEI